MCKILFTLIALMPAFCMAQEAADSSSTDSTQRTFVVVNMETGVPVRDVLVYTDNGQGAKTAWDGTFRIEKAFRRVSFTHGGYVKRIMDVEEMQGDTIALLPNMLAMGEVVIWGHRRNMTASIIPKPSKTDLQLQQAVPQGFNPLGLLFLGFDQLWGKKMRHSKAAKEQKKKMIIENY